MMVKIINIHQCHLPSYVETLCKPHHVVLETDVIGFTLYATTKLSEKTQDR